MGKLKSTKSFHYCAVRGCVRPIVDKHRKYCDRCRGKRHFDPANPKTKQRLALFESAFAQGPKTFAELTAVMAQTTVFELIQFYGEQGLLIKTSNGKRHKWRLKQSFLNPVKSFKLAVEIECDDTDAFHMLELLRRMPHVVNVQRFK